MMKKEKIYILGIWILLCLPISAHAARYIGVLAPQGEVVAQEMWQPWLSWLKQQIPEEDWVLIPLSLSQWHSSVEAGRLDFAIGPQVQFVSLPDTAGWSWLATLKPERGSQRRAIEQIGSTIWVKKDSPIHDVSDLSGKHISAVDPQAFGGGMLGENILLNLGLRNGRDYELIFTGYPVDTSLKALVEGKVDAAITPLCLMEEWERKGYLNMADYRPIYIDEDASRIGCISSTKVFPHWLLAASPNVPEELSTRMSGILFSSNAPKNLPHWLPPASASSVEQVLASLGKHPHQVRWQEQWRNWIYQHQLLVTLLLGLLFISLINYIWMGWLAQRRRRKLVKAYATLRERDQMMAHADRLSIAGEMAAGLAHELNQPLTVIRHYAEAGKMMVAQSSTVSDETVIKTFENIIDATERSRQIMKGMRQWLRPSETQYIWLDFEKLFTDCHEWLGWYNQTQPVTLLAETTCRYIYTDGAVVQQVLTNCLLNSCEQGATKIEVFVTSDSEAITIVVQDNGGGFSETYLARPFSAFYTTKSKGLGLGLAISRRLLERIGASISLGNRKDAIAGAYIVIKLPLASETGVQND